MATSKIILLCIVFFISGGIFAAMGFYFNSEIYLKYLGNNKTFGQHAAKLAKTVGAVTIATGLLILIFKSATQWIVVAYLVVLLIVVSVISAMFKKK